jgi:His/Glu/Gln/Arg/opine family amino acid ABC transporter permease subunit
MLMTLLASFDWSFIWENRSVFLDGLWMTLKVSLIAIAGSFAVGLVLGAARAYRIPVASQLAAVYVEVMRNTPILVQVFFVYFGLSQPPFELRLTAFTAAWVTLVVWGGAFNTENFRAGFEAVPYRYREAALALGFGRVATFLNVTLPIGGRIALPSSINTCVSVLKNSALIGPAISLPELTYQAYSLESVSFRATEIYFTLAVIYLAVVWALSGLIRGLEARLALPEARRVRRRRQWRLREAV